MPLQLKSEGELLNSSPSGDGGSKKKILTLKSEEELIPTNESKTNYVFGKGTTSLQDPLKYDFQTKTGIDNQELAAQSQGRIAKLGAGLVNTASSLVLDGLKDASYLLDFEQVGNLAKGTEQEFGNWFGDLMEQAKEASHMDVFRTKDSLGFHPESAGWWADAMPSIASGLSMIAPALGATKLISGVGKLTGMSKVMRGLGIAEEATAGITGAVVSRYMENTMEGKQTFDSTYQQAIAKGLSEEEAIAKAGEAARQNWTTNSAMLLQDIPQYMSFFKGFKGISAMLGESNKALGTAAKVGLTMGSEAAEEGFQFISDKEATRSALLDNKEVGKDNTFSDRMKDYMQDPEFWNSTFLGAIGGGIFEGVSQFKEGKRQKTYDSTLAMHKAVLTGDKPGYYRAQDNQFNDTTLEHLQKGTLDSFKDQLLFLKNNPERIEDPQERAEVMQRLDSKIQDLEYIEDLQKKLTLDKTKSNELKGLEIGASLSQRLAENRLRSVNLEINKANGEVIQTLSELPPDVIAYKQAKLTLDGMKQIEGLESKSKLLETNINNTAKDLVAAYPNLFESIEELNKTITTTADNTLVNLNKSKQIELKSIEESKDILFQINDPSKQKDLEEHITKLKEEAKKKEEERLKKEKAASGTPTDETEETTSTTSSTEQFAPGSQVQFRGQGQSVEVEDFDVEEGLVKIKGDDNLYHTTDFYVPKTLPSTGPEVLNNTDLTQPYTGESEDGTGVHAVGTKAAVQEILNTVSDITPITRVRLTKKVSVEGNIQRGLNHLLGKFPSSVKATLSPNKALDVVYELQTPDGTWIDAFHGRHSDQYVTVDEKGNTSTFRFTDNNRTQAKTLFKIREGDADNKKVRDLTDEEITDLINNQHKLDALNKVYQSIYNTQGETTLSAKELNEKYGITVFAKKGKFDTIKDDAVKPILSEISKANIDGEFYIFDKLNGSTWEELQLLGNPNNKDKSKELLSKVKNPNNFIGATNSRYLALGREANGELFLFGIDTQIFTNDQLSPIISNILQHKKFKNGKWEYSEKTKIGETERNEINDELSELIHIIAPTGTKLELKLDVSKDGQPSKLQIKEHTPAKANTEGYNKDGEKYYDIPLSKKTSINSIVTHANEKGLKYIHPESFRRSIPKTENTDKIPTKELAGMFLSNVSKNVFKYSKIIVDLNIPSEDIFGKILPAETKVAPTTVTPKSQSISANTIKDQITALEDKIANSSSEEEANSYFIEIEALEKQLLEGRKLESDIDRLRGETPINKISQQSAQTFIDFPEAEANIRKLISPASVVNFDDINTLITNIENKGETWGFFAGKSIYLNKAAQKGTEFHEVFHYVFRRLISDEQIRRLHMLARVKYGTPTIKQLSELKNQSNANKSLRKDQLEELWLEEKMADTFMNYKLGKNKLENMGLIGKILSKIQDFLTWLVGHKTELQALFENINKGSFRSDITHYNQFTKKWANPVFKQIPNGEKDTETGKRYTYTGLEEGRQIIRTIAAKVISAKMGTSKARMDVDILLDAMIARAYQFNSLENNKDIIASKSPIEGLKIKRWLRSQQFVYSNPTSVALIKEQVKKQLDIFNFDKVDLDEEITATENERKLIDFDKNAINIGGFDSLNKEIRAYIGTTLYDTTDALGRPVKTAVDPQVVYQSIMKTLASTDVGNMMNKFRIFAENNQQTKAVYDRLTSETGYDETIGVAKLNPQLLQQFLNAFTTEKIKYLQILPNLETQTYKVFDANNAGKAQVDQWEKNFSETKDLTKSKIALQDAGSDLATGNIDKLDSIKKALASIGIDVSDTYIRYSLLAISDPFNPLVANYKDVKPLTRDDLSALAGILAKDNSPYEKGTKGAITRLQNIAQANYVFDEQVVSPNFQDANGETRYSYIKPSLMLERTRELKQSLSTPEGRKAFIEQLNTSYSHSYAFNDNNYLLTHKNADEIFSNLQLEFTGDIRQDKKGQEGTTFKGIDDRSFKLMQYGLFSAQKKIGDVTFAKFYPKVLEASASAYSVELPVEKLYSNGRPTDRAINLLYDQFLQEVERIAITEREINNPDVVKIKDYHIGKLRGLHLFYFKYLENTKLGEQILSKAKNYVSKADFHDMEEAIKTEIEANLLNEIKQENQLLEDLGITSQNLLPKNVSTKDDIGNFYVNSLININAYNDLIEMNPAFSKDGVDNVKRAKRAISAKVSFGKGNHIVGFYKEPKAKGLTKDIDVADAQAMIDMNHFKFILQREGKLSPEIFSILNKIDDGEELTWDEILTLKDKQVMLNSIKTVTSGPVDYHKMSDLILTKKLTSVKNDKGEWVAKPGKELLHNFRVQLENLSRRATMAQNPDFQWHQQMSIEQIDQIVPARILPESASKLLTYKPAELGPDGRYDFNHTNTRLIENKYSGRQVDTPSGKTEIVYGTQLIQLIDSEQDDNTIVNFQGEDISLKELRHIYQNLLSQARTNSVDQAKKFLGKLVDGNLTEKEETKFRKKLLDTLEQSGADDSLLQFFGLDPMYNLNLPNTLNKYEQLFLAHFTKGVLNQKTAGLKLTLISDYGFNVKDEKTGEYRPLKYNPSGLSEVAMPAFTRELHNLKPGDILNAKQVLEMFGQRIPTQDKHSMIAFKVVEFLPSEYGSVGIFPKEVIELSGADFDIDSIFVERKDFYMKGDKFVPFGTATTLEGKFEEFIQDQKQNNKDFIKLIKLGVPEQEALIELQLPSTLEEFKKETKGGTITLSNATINNQLVDANIAFLTNKSMVEKGIPQTPATVRRLSDVRDKIQALKGIDTSKQANLNSPIGQFTAWKSNSTGKENVGPAANTNLARAFLYKAKVHLQRDTFRPEFNGTKYFDYSKNKDTTEARIQDTLSTILSAMTDNAKDPIAGDLNLSLTSLGPVLQLVSLGVDLYDAMLLVNQPIVKEYTEAKERTKTAIKSDADYAVRTSEIKENLFNKYKLTSSDDLSLTTKEMEEGINTIKPKDGKYLDVFFKLEEQGRYWQHLSKLLALNKGLPASFKETEKIKAAIEAFKLNSEEELPKEAPFDIRKALKGTHIENNIRLFKDIMNMSKQYFITQSSVFTKTIDEIENSIKENIRDKAGVLNDIKLDFLSYLAIDQYKKTIKRPLNQNLLTGPDSIIDQYKKIPAELKNNKLIKFLTIDNKTTVPTLIANTRIKLSGIQIEELVESSRELFNDERTNQFARNLFEYLIVKDGMQFKNNSFIKFISPFMFTQMSDSLDVLSEEAFNDKISEESANNFKDVWFRHVDNQNYIKRLEPSKSITFSEENNQVRVKSFIKDVTLPEYTYINKVLHKAVTLDKNNATYEAVSPIGNELQSPYSFKNAEEVSKNARLSTPIQTETIKKLNISSGNPKNYINYSGAAQGGDTIWASIGKEFGIGKQVDYRPEHLKQLTPDQDIEVEKAYQQAVKDLGRRPLEKGTFAGGLVRRDYLQAKAADGIFAISTLVSPGQKDSKGYTNKTNSTIISGGTGYAVQMAINLGKEVHVYDQTKKQWYKYQYNQNLLGEKTKGDFIKESTPILTQKYAGIGTREINEFGKQAIRDVYEKTFTKLDVNQAKASIEDGINYSLKAVDILLSDKAKQIFEKGKKANWDLNKILTELQIPKEQKQLILDLGITEREQLISNTQVKPGVKEVFNNNPKLASIGTQEQYSQYLDVIFPDSKVKDIVYHGSSQFGFDKFSKEKLGEFTGSGSAKLGFFFSNNLENSFSAYTVNVQKDVSFSDDGSVDGVEGTFGLSEIDSLIKDLDEGRSFVDSEIRNKEYLVKSVSKSGGISYSIPSKTKEEALENYKKDDWNYNPDAEVEVIENINYGKYKYSKVDWLKDKPVVYYKEELGTNNRLSISEEEYTNALNKRKDFLLNERAKYIKEQSKNRVYSILLNSKDLKEFDDKGNEWREETYVDRIQQTLSENKDGLVIKNTYDPLLNDVYVVFEPEQIHILGSKQDMQGFKDFIAKSQQLNLREEIITSSHLEAIKLSLSEKEQIGKESDIIDKYIGESPNSTKIIQKIIENTQDSPAFNKLASTIKSLQNRNKTLSVQVVDKFTSEILEKHKFDLSSGKVPAAFWSPNENKIYLSKELLSKWDESKFQRIFLHELMHSYTNYPFYKDSSKLNTNEKQFIKSMKTLYDIAKKETKNPSLYGYTDVQEFVSEIMTSSSFVGDIKSLSPDLSIWDKIVNAIYRFLTGETLYDKTTNEIYRYLNNLDKVDPLVNLQYEVRAFTDEKINISESVFKEQYVFFKKRINALEKQKHLHSAKSEEYAKIQAKIDAIQTKLDEAIAESGHEGFLEMAKSTLGFLELNTIVRLETGNIDVTADQIEYAKDILDAFDDFEGLETEVAALRKRLFPFANKLRMEQIIEHSTEATPPTQEGVDNQKKDIGSFKSWVGALADSPNYIARTIGMIIKAAQNRVETQNKKLKDVIQKEVDLLHEWGKKAGVASKNLYDVFIQEDKGTLVLTKPTNEQFYTDLYEAFGKIKSTDPKIKAEGQQWIKNNAIKENGEWKSTNSKYSNKNWEKIQSTPDLKRFYDFYQQHIEEQQKFLPNKFGRNYIPNIRKETFGNILKNLIPVKRNLDGRLIISEELEADILPNMYHKRLSAADKSRDLGASLLKFGQYSNNHNEMTDILPSLRLLQDGLIHKYNDKGQIIKKEYIKSSSPDKSILGESTNLYKQVSTIIDMQVLGNMKKEQGAIPWGDVQDENGKTIGKKHILVSDVADVLLKYNSLLRIGFSPVTAVTNVFFGDISNIIEAIGGRFFSLKNMKDATNIFIAQNFKEDSFFYKLLEETNPLQELDDYDNITDVSIKTKEMSAAKLQEFAYAMQKGGEKYLQGRTALAVAIKDGYCTTKGQPTDKWNNATEKEKTELSNKIQRINQMIHGRYSQKEAAALQQNVVFRLAMQFRKWIPSALEARFNEKQWDNRLQAYIEGRYRTTGKLLYELYKNKGKLENGRELTELELYNVKKMVVELTLWAATAFGFALLHGGDDEEAKRRRKNPYVKLGLTLLNRVSGDLQYFYDPKSATSLTKSSIPVATTIETLFKAMGYLPGAFGEDAYYTKGSRKGKHKFTSTLARTIPGAKVVDDITRIASDNTLEELNK